MGGSAGAAKRDIYIYRAVKAEGWVMNGYKVRVKYTLNVTSLDSRLRVSKFG